MTQGTAVCANGMEEGCGLTRKLTKAHINQANTWVNDSDALFDGHLGLCTCLPGLHHLQVGIVCRLLSTTSASFAPPTKMRTHSPTPLVVLRVFCSRIARHESSVYPAGIDFKQFTTTLAPRAYLLAGNLLSYLLCPAQHGQGHATTLRP